MAAETSADAHLPVSIVLLKLHFELFWEKLYSTFFSSSSTESTTTTTPSTTTNTHGTTKTRTATFTNEDHLATDDNDSLWDLYLMAALLGLIGALYTMRRQRAALIIRQQQPVQAPVQ
ncbi:unnamed protein product [Adineta steineri]|nr:unnamed protein product [Adineta steineri]